MPLTKITRGALTADIIDSTKLADNAVDTEHLADDAVEAAELASDAVVNLSVASGAAIATSKLSGALTSVTSSGLGTAAARAAEDTMTDGSNLPDGAAIKAYGDTNWGAGGWVKIGTSTATSVSYIDIEHGNGFDGTYDVYKIFVSNLYGTSDGQWFECRLKIGGSYKSDNYYSMGILRLSGTGHGVAADYNAGQLLLHSNQGVDGTKETTSLEITFHNPDNTTHNKHVSWIGSQAEQSAGRTEGIVGGGGYYGSQAALTGFRFQLANGDIASATFASYGLVK